MGIDVYMKWDGQTEDEHQAQLCGFKIDQGKVGYLREAYHGSPYATQVLVPEGWADERPEDGVPIPAATLRARLDEVIASAIERGRVVYKEALTTDSPEVRAFIDFVELAERKEAETGNPVRIVVSA